MNNDEIILKSWELYFLPEEYTIFNSDIQLVCTIRKLLVLQDPEINSAKSSGIFSCSYALYEALGKPGQIKCISCAVSEKIHEITGELREIETRIETGKKQTDFSAISKESVGSLVSIKGIVSRVGFRKIKNLVAMFECLKCSRIIKIKVEGNIYKPPTCQCKSKNVVFLSNHTGNRCTDYQEIKVQELSAVEKSIETVDVDIYGQLVGAVAPGDVVDMTGVVKAELVAEAYRLKIECNNVEILQGNKKYGTSFSCRGREAHAETLSDFEIFKRLSEEGDVMRIFTEAFYSEIVGNELIKKGLVLSLFGGTQKHAGVCPVRGEIHVLIVGDPGLGKSRMLAVSAGILPKSTLVSGNFCTTAGLTLSMSYDPLSNEYMADAGALVISDGGVCCVDELDKLDDYSSLLETMEDQTVTVAKGGVICTVPARTTILAAANPRYGHFRADKTLRENLKFDSALLSRFDLVYVLKDDYSEGEDYEISNKILENRILGRDSKTDNEIINEVTNEITNGVANNIYNNGVTNKIYNNEITNKANIHRKYDRTLLIKYIEYARETGKPVLSKLSKDLLREYYIGLRKEHPMIGLRVFESLVRLSESYAKLELKAIVSVEHVKKVIEIYKNVVIKEGGIKKRGIEGCLREYVESYGRFIEKDDLVGLIRRSNVKREPEEYIEIMNCQGIVLNLGKNKYKVLIS